MSDATVILIVQVICATIITVVTLLTRQDLKRLKPEIISVRQQLVDANIFIGEQVRQIGELRDEIASHVPQMKTGKSDEEYTAIPPYRKPDRKT